MPNTKERHKSSNAERKFIEMGIGGNAYAAQKSQNAMLDDAYGVEVPTKKKINMKRRSGTADNDRDLTIQNI